MSAAGHFGEAETADDFGRRRRDRWSLVWVGVIGM